MKYFIRSLKYYCYLMILLTIIVLALVLTGFVEADLSKMFVNGYDSLWQIALFMLAFALFYPRFGFSKRTIHIYGSQEEVRPAVMRVMQGLGYGLENDSDGRFAFRRRSGFSRALKMWEDRITLSPSVSGWEAEGLTRDLGRIVSALEATREDV